MNYDVIIIGAGGAGLMAAATAGQNGAKVLLIDHALKAGKKILISGGGRCNFTNLGVEASCFLSDNPHFAKSALRRYTQWDFLDLVERYKIKWHEKTLGQLFCDGSAREIVAMLLAECDIGGVTLRLNQPVNRLERIGDGFLVNGDQASKLVIATGGPSIPKMGASGFAYKIAEQFGLNIVTPRPALVPLTLGDEYQLFKGITGVSCPVVAMFENTSFEEAALFTHRGLSGPAILQISSYWRAGAAIHLNLLQDAAQKLVAAKRDMPRAKLKAALSVHFPSRLADALADKFPLASELGNVPDAKLGEIGAALSKFEFVPSGTEGYAKAEVTAGGVDTAELSSQTMQSTKVPGLYFIGEAVDVTGWLGGYNFQWAWSSGVAAGLAITS